MLGAELVPSGDGFVYRIRPGAAEPPRAGARPTPVARLPVSPGGSDLCFAWRGPIAGAIAHLERRQVAVELGPAQRFGRRGGQGTSIYFRGPGGFLLDFIGHA